MSTPTKNINAEKIQGNLSINSITASTISATTYQNLPTDIRVTGATYNNANTFTFTNNTGSTFNVSFDVLTGLTINGNLSATTIYGNGSNITGINFSQLATSAHTHTISDVINLQTDLDAKIDKPANPYLGDYLYYNGITWVPNQINIPVAAGAGVTLFLSISGSSLPTYEYLSQFPIELTESQEPVIVNNNQALIGKYATEQLNRTVVDPGIWEFNTYASVDIPSTGLTQIIVNAYLLTTGGSETFLFSAATENITTTAATIYTISVVEPQYSCNTTDYLVVNYSASTTNNFNTTVTLYHGGALNYSHVHTPFVTLHNDLAGIQGGFSNEHYHLSKNETDLLTTGVDASSIHHHDSLYLSLGGGIVTGNTEFTQSLSASTIFSGATNLIDIFAPIVHTHSQYATLTGATFTGQVNAPSLSATTYLGLPLDVFVTGATKSGSVATFTNNTGGTFTLTGLTDTFVTGGTYNQNNSSLSFFNNTGGTFTVTGITTSSAFTGGTVTGATNFTGNLSASTIFSGSTNIENIFSQNRIRTMGVSVDGNGGIILTGSTGFSYLPYQITLTNWAIFSDITGSTVFDLRVNGTTIVGAGNKPTLSSSSANTQNISSWTTTSLSAGTLVEFVCEEATGVTRVNLFVNGNTN